MNSTTRMRIDKWLWAARFFKTRSLARQAVDSGKVEIDGQRAKPAREIQVGALLSIRQGWDEKQVRVLTLSDQRRGAPEAALLYEETPESRVQREQRAEMRRTAGNLFNAPDSKPNTRDRRLIHRFKREQPEA